METKGDKKLAPLCQCGSPLYVSIGYTGADWDTIAGDGSGYGYEVSLRCNKCNRSYAICNLKENKISTRPNVYRDGYSMP